jgi:hypothetical protein
MTEVYIYLEDFRLLNIFRKEEEFFKLMKNGELEKIEFILNAKLIKLNISEIEPDDLLEFPPRLYTNPFLACIFNCKKLTFELLSLLIKYDLNTSIPIDYRYNSTIEYVIQKYHEIKIPIDTIKLLIENEIKLSDGLILNDSRIINKLINYYNENYELLEVFIEFGFDFTNIDTKVLVYMFIKFPNSIEYFINLGIKLPHDIINYIVMDYQKTNLVSLLTSYGANVNFYSEDVLHPLVCLIECLQPVSKLETEEIIVNDIIYKLKCSSNKFFANFIKLLINAGSTIDPKLNGGYDCIRMICEKGLECEFPEFF